MTFGPLQTATVELNAGRIAALQAQAEYNAFMDGLTVDDTGEVDYDPPKPEILVGHPLPDAAKAQAQAPKTEKSDININIGGGGASTAPTSETSANRKKYIWIAVAIIAFVLLVILVLKFLNKK